jgi:hypothetical protein
MFNSAADDRKRKLPQTPHPVSSNDGRNPNEESNKFHKMSTDPSASTCERVATADRQSASNAPEHEMSMKRIREKIQDLSSSDNVEVNAAFVVLSMDLKKHPTTHDNNVAAEGCRALVHI